MENRDITPRGAMVCFTLGCVSALTDRTMATHGQESQGLRDLSSKPEQRTHSVPRSPRVHAILTADETNVHLFHFAVGSH